MSNPEEITFQLDTLLTEVEETQLAIEEIEEVFARPTDLLRDLEAYSSEPGDESTGPEQTRVKE